MFRKYKPTARLDPRKTNIYIYLLKFTRPRKFAGIVPFKPLLSATKLINWDRLPIDEGISPLILIFRRLILVSEVIAPIESGILPPRRLLFERSISCILLRHPILLGMFPDKLFLCRYKDSIQQG